MGEVLVCPTCGSDRTGTLESATIWQDATFTLIPDVVKGDVELADRTRGAEIEWDSYSTEDVGDTETVGYVCKACLTTWDSEPGSLGPCPFVPRSEVKADA